MLFDSFDVVCSGLRPHAVLAEVWRFIETQLFFQKSNKTSGTASTSLTKNPMKRRAQSWMEKPSRFVADDFAGTAPLS
jgi:hypothetical protein